MFLEKSDFTVAIPFRNKFEIGDFDGTAHGTIVLDLDPSPSLYGQILLIKASTSDTKHRSHYIELCYGQPNTSTRRIFRFFGNAGKYNERI